jgi:hypothetical protein
MTGVAQDFAWNIRQRTVIAERERIASGHVRVSEHYARNTMLLLALILDDLQEYRDRDKRTRLGLKQAYILRIFVPGRDFEPGRTVHGQPARTAGEELFGVVHGLGPFLRMSL